MQLTQAGMLRGEPYSGVVTVSEVLTGYTGEARIVTLNAREIITDAVPMTQNGAEWSFTFPSTETAKVGVSKAEFQAKFIAPDDAQAGWAVITVAEAY